MNLNNITLSDGEELILPAGIHTVTAPIRIKGNNITVRGEDGAELHAVQTLENHQWDKTENGVFYTEIGADVQADALYIGDRKYRMARYPKYTSDDLVFGGYAADCTEPSKTAQWNDPSGGYIHAMHRHLWGGYSYKITGKQPDGSLSLIGGWQNNRQMGMHDTYRYAENIFEELTEPGEWFFDEKNHRVFVIPYPDDDLSRAEIAVSHCFFEICDASGIRIENIAFSRGSRTFMETSEPLLRSDWTVFRGGAVLIRDSSNCTIDRCTFADIGSNAVFVSGNCENIRVSRCYLHDIGGSGVCFVGKPDAVRNPLFEYNETQPLSTLDLTAGPKSDSYVRRCCVEDCLISHTGTVEKQSAGVQISMASEITVRNCTVCHTPRAGINISEGTFGGHLIEGCDVFDTVRETGDHGSFNSWGRDRYWHAQGLADEDAFRYALLDCVKQNVIRRNRFRCDHGWDIDLDDGSSDYLIEQNLCLNGGIKLREGFFRTVQKNITVGNTVHFHVWYPKSGDAVTENLVFKPWAPIGMPKAWGKIVDHNILHDPNAEQPVKAESLQKLSGQDSDSVSMDCRFSDSTYGDFIPCAIDDRMSVFADFPRVFGVRYEPLRAIADTPRISGETLSSENHAQTVCRYGAYVRNIISDGEMSVYGTAGHCGVLILDVPSDSEANKFGIRIHDVIVEIDGNAIHCADTLPEKIRESVTILRRQTRVELSRSEQNSQ